MSTFSKRAKAEASIYKHQISPKSWHKYDFGCGANKEGGGGFQPGNSCGGDSDGKDDAGDQGGGDEPKKDMPKNNRQQASDALKKADDLGLPNEQHAMVEELIDEGDYEMAIELVADWVETEGLDPTPVSGEHTPAMDKFDDAMSNEDHDALISAYNDLSEDEKDSLGQDERALVEDLKSDAAEADAPEAGGAGDLEEIEEMLANPDLSDDELAAAVRQKEELNVERIRTSIQDGPAYSELNQKIANLDRDAAGDVDDVDLKTLSDELENIAYQNQGKLSAAMKNEGKLNEPSVKDSYRQYQTLLEEMSGGVTNIDDLERYTNETEKLFNDLYDSIYRDAAADAPEADDAGELKHLDKSLTRVDEMAKDYITMASQQADKDDATWLSEAAEQLRSLSKAVRDNNHEAVESIYQGMDSADTDEFDDELIDYLENPSEHLADRKSDSQPDAPEADDSGQILDLSVPVDRGTAEEEIGMFVGSLEAMADDIRDEEDDSDYIKDLDTTLADAKKALRDISSKIKTPARAIRSLSQETVSMMLDLEDWDSGIQSHLKNRQRQSS